MVEELCEFGFSHDGEIVNVEKLFVEKLQNQMIYPAQVRNQYDEMTASGQQAYMFINNVPSVIEMLDEASLINHVERFFIAVVKLVRKKVRVNYVIGI
jgi:hypothetical protein